jgi:hypothetical protein
MKQILNNILNANTWLFLELVIITIAAWVVFEPAIVNLYYRYLPLGYDADRLLYVESEKNPWDNKPEEDDSGSPYDRLVKQENQTARQLKAIEGAASVYSDVSSASDIGHSWSVFRKCCVGTDTLALTNVSFVPDAQFFETYGLKPLPGSPKAEELSHITMQEQKVVLTRSGAMALFGTPDVVGRQLTISPNLVEEMAVAMGNNTVNFGTFYKVTVAGVVDDFRKSLPATLQAIIIMPREHTFSGQYIIRLKPGINAHRFIEERGHEIMQAGKRNSQHINRMMTFDDHLQQMELDTGRTQEVNRKLMLALFFLVNLMLAVIGTVWLHAKRRTEECGVHRAFGATKLHLLLGFLWRNALLGTAAVIVGLIIYLNYAHSSLHVGENGEYCETFFTIQNYALSSDKTWVDYFWPHFLVVSVIVYLIILCAVLIATAIPAWRICRSEITEALKDE